MTPIRSAAEMCWLREISTVLQFFPKQFARSIYICIIYHLAQTFFQITFVDIIIKLENVDVLTNPFNLGNPVESKTAKTMLNLLKLGSMH